MEKILQSEKKCLTIIMINYFCFKEIVFSEKWVSVRNFFW